VQAWQALCGELSPDFLYLSQALDSRQRNSTPGVGEHNVVKAFTRLFLSLERKHFKIKFDILCPLTATLAICLENIRPLFMVTPKSTNSCAVDK